MTKLSRNPVDSKRMGYFINNFRNAVTLLENKEEVKEFFKDIVTYTEIRMLSKRLQIAKMLLEGYDYQTIKRYVKVTDSTISKINDLLRKNGTGIKAAVEYLQKIDEKREKELRAQSPTSFANIKKRYKGYYWHEEVFSLLEKALRKRTRKKSVK
jgi:TrpR-related protein YerC/YecD